MDKTKMGITLYNVKSIDKYWVSLEKDLEIMLRWLQRKHEYGTSAMCSERGIQQSLVHYALNIAQKHGFDTVKTQCVCMAVGLCFPMYGSYGIAALENYMKSHNIKYDTIELKIGAIEHILYHGGNRIVTPQLDEALHAYYENRTDISEVNIARYCQNKIMESRELMKEGMFAGEAISTVMDCAEDSFSAEKSIMINASTNIIVPNEVQESVDEILDDFIEFCGLPEGIFEYMV